MRGIQAVSRAVVPLGLKAQRLREVGFATVKSRDEAFGPGTEQDTYRFDGLMSGQSPKRIDEESDHLQRIFLACGALRLRMTICPLRLSRPFTR